MQLHAVNYWVTSEEMLINHSNALGSDNYENYALGQTWSNIYRIMEFHFPILMTKIVKNTEPILWIKVKLKTMLIMKRVHHLNIYVIKRKIEDFIEVELNLNNGGQTYDENVSKNVKVVDTGIQNFRVDIKS